MRSDEVRCIADLPRQFNAAQDLMSTNLAAGRHEKTALIDCRGALTYAGLAERVDRMAGAMSALGLRRGDRILLCLLDTRDFPTVFLGAIKAGVIPVPLNTLLTGDDYRWILENSGARAVFVTGELADKWTPIAAANPSIGFVSSEGGPWRDLESLLDDATPLGHAADTDREDIAFWLYTSGSTGRPKGAMHRHGSLRLTANLFGQGIAALHENDVVYSVAKQFFAYGLGNSLTFPFAVGATAILYRDRVTPDVVSKMLIDHRVTFFAAVPTFLANWLDHPGCPGMSQLPRLRLATSAGETLPARLAVTFRARFGADIIDGLGSTEMLHIFLSQRPEHVRHGCTGKPVDGYRVRLVDDHGAEVADGEIGNLHISGPTSATAYWQNAEKSAATFQDDWTISGDKYVRDAEGWYSYAGRSDDMLKVGGIYVSPIEIEEALLSHAHVLEAAVVGAAGADGMVKPHAFVVLRKGAAAGEETKAALKTHVKSLLAPYKYPRRITFLPELPKTATGKILRFKLRETT
ncbi:benzoate-CoA ligase family protein [Sphingobium sp. EM0848]|uniref:benzoate-CoA ligase family protein n=1 Tax=Sphingobium sp. EM0848 TaxID=2743473 RepID=UPI00159C120F|nr:benzoate-CoA ligase family protein [Sphingobium sp. EM0848]